jgi:hypothetical protein
MPYRLTITGAQQAGTYNGYGYTMTLDSTRMAVSFTLPANSHVTVLAVTLGQ